jgi:tetratricopeptide (TPR) repeat protein
MKRMSIVVLALTLFAGWGAAVWAQDKPAEKGRDAGDAGGKADPKAAKDGKQAAPAVPPLSRKETVDQAAASEEFFARYLLSELAGQRGSAPTASREILNLAKTTRDGRLARRAAEVAFRARDMELAFEATSLWIDIEPDSREARQVLSTIAARQGNFDTVKANYAKRLAEPGKAPELFMLLPTMLLQASASGADGKLDRNKAVNAVRELAKPYPQIAESHFAIALSTATAGDSKAAMIALDEALRLKPKFVRAVKLKSDLLAETSDEKALQYLKGFLDTNADVDDVRLNYAQLLIGQKSYVSAREELRRVDRNNTSNARVPFSIGMLSQQMGDFADAEKNYLRSLALKPADPNVIYFGLGQVAESQKDTNKAIDWFGKVKEGDSFVGAKLRIANLLAKRDGMDSGRKFLREAQDAEDDSPETRTQLVLAEVQLLREAKAFREAFSLLSTAIEKAPNTPEFLYDRAMIAEKLDRYDVLEKDLRRVIEIKPDYAHAYNALGYTFADRNIRLEEAYSLIQKAIKLAPDDASIQDSVGWVQYRMGRLPEAEVSLRKAYDLRRDAEIAAHLGEVLWAQGKRDEAQKIWRAALDESPGNEVLIAVLAKHKP